MDVSRLPGSRRAVVPLAEQGRGVAARLERFGDRDLFGGQVERAVAGDAVVDAVLARSCSAARRGADDAGGVPAAEDGPLASRSRLDVVHSLRPLKPTSAQPRSSARMRMMLGLRCSPGRCEEGGLTRSASDAMSSRLLRTTGPPTPGVFSGLVSIGSSIDFCHAVSFSCSSSRILRAGGSLYRFFVSPRVVLQVVQLVAGRW